MAKVLRGNKGEAKKFLIAISTAIFMLGGLLIVPSAHAAGVTGTVEFWSWNGGGNYQTVDEDAVARFEAANPGAKVKLTYIAWADYITKVKASFAAGNPPDIMQLPWAGEFRDIVDAGQLLPMDNYLKTGFPAFSKSGTEAVTLKGKKWAMPLDLNTLQIAYNVDVFKKLGLTPPRSTADLLQIGKKLKSKKLYGLSVGLKDQWVGGDLWFAQVAYTDKTGTALAAADAGTIPWTAPALVKAGDNVAAMVKSGLFAPGANSMASFTEALDLFTAGKAGMYYPIGNFASDFVDTSVNGKFKWSMFPFPGGGADVQRATGGIARMFAMPKDGGNAAAAVEFLKYFTNAEGSKQLLKYAFIPAWDVTIPAGISPFFQSFLKWQPTARSRVIYTSSVYTALLNAMQPMLDGDSSGMDVSKALMKARP